MFDDRVPLVLNAAAGSKQSQPVTDELTSLLRSHGIEVRLAIAAGGEIESRVQDELAAGATHILVAGGDGSISAAAGAICGTDAVLGVLPLGTANHFAKDLGIPGSLRRSVECLATGVVRRVDVATVNGRVFVNNSSIGAYPELLELRKSRQRHGRRRATLLALFETLRRSAFFRTTIDVGAERIQCVTPFVFVGNNAYDGSVLSQEWRARLDGGKLWLCALQQPGKAKLLKAMARLVWKGAPDAPQLLVRSAEAVTVHVDRKQVVVAHDGESDVMAPPLDYRVRPRALRVMAPKVA